MNGKAPGIAPTKTANGLINFIGVYIAVYIKIETAASMATLILIKYINKTPIKAVIIAKNNAVFLVISFFGRGLFLVLIISLSKSFSII